MTNKLLSPEQAQYYKDQADKLAQYQTDAQVVKLTEDVLLAMKVGHNCTPTKDYSIYGDSSCRYGKKVVSAVKAKLEELGWDVVVEDNLLLWSVKTTKQEEEKKSKFLGVF